MDSVLDVRDLRIDLSSSGVDIVDEVAMELRPGEVLGLVGESGSGKTTVGMSLLGYTRPGARVAHGQIVIAGRALESLTDDESRRLRGGTISYIPQDPGTALNPALRIGRQLMEILTAHGLGRDAERRVLETLEQVALPAEPEFLRRYPHQLSGGQQQRVAIAMAFACRPRLIVCDEPTTGLDVTTQARVLNTIRDLTQSHKVAAIYVSHDLAVVSEIADRVAVMYAGRVVESGRAESIFTAARHPYTRRLLQSVPDVGARGTVVGIPGHAPAPAGRPPGCHFHPRCSFALPKCRVEFPEVTRMGADHTVRCFVASTLPAASVQTGAVPEPAVAGGVVLAVDHLTASHGSREVVHDTSLVVRTNECVALVGESGSGKTTLARCIAGLHKHHSGAVLLDGDPLPKSARARTVDARKRIQYVFQNPYASLNPRRTIMETLARQLSLFSPVPRREVAARVGQCLEHVALSPMTAVRHPDELSGGELQRVAIARALIAEPTIVICDEITSALDVSVQAAIVGLLGRLREEVGLSLLFITHNLALIRSISDRVEIMNAGRIVEAGAVDDVFASPANDYTKQLLKNTPSINRSAKSAAGFYAQSRSAVGSGGVPPRGG